MNQDMAGSHAAPDDATADAGLPTGRADQDVAQQPIGLHRTQILAVEGLRIPAGEGELGEEVITWLASG
jgi:hypothetical protein